MSDKEIRDIVSKMLADWNSMPPRAREAVIAEARRRAEQAEAFLRWFAVGSAS